MRKLQKIITEIHLYENKIEALIKIVIWIISWIGGILALLGTDEKRVLGSAYFIYMLSLLMEFAPKIYKKTEFWSKFLHTIFCFAMSIVCLLSIGILFGASLPNIFFNIMLGLTIFIIVYMIIDLFILWVGTERNITCVVNNNADKDLDKQKIKFEERLSEGYLGNIKEGVKYNE